MFTFYDGLFCPKSEKLVSMRRQFYIGRICESSFREILSICIHFLLYIIYYFMSNHQVNAKSFIWIK